MDGHDLFLLISMVVGGLAIFIFGMNVMTEGLRQVAGTGLRTILGYTSRNALAGLGFGTVLGVLVHSSATTVMLVGFANAGLMTLVQTVPPILGANIGTTISMQFISFKLGAYCFFAIGVGFMLEMVGWNLRSKQIGRAILGFGLLFLGMNIMSDAIRPHRELLAPFLAGVDGSTWVGMLKGVGLSFGLTAIWQSSGATIAMCFALTSAGVFVDLEQVYPIILGAHIGTCATALLGSLGTNIVARRCACVHLLFNVMNVLLAVVCKPVFIALALFSASDLTRQIANVHSIIMITAAVLILPLSGAFATLVVRLFPTRHPLPEPSHLDDKLINTPERAVAAAIQELHRVGKLCVQSLRLAAETMLFEHNRKTVQGLQLNEKVIDEIKLSMRDYLAALTERDLSRRQAILIEHINRCMADIERIGDHIDEIGQLSLRRQKTAGVMVDAESMQKLTELYGSAVEVVQLVVASMVLEGDAFAKKGDAILQGAKQFEKKEAKLKECYVAKLAAKEYSPIAGMYFMEYITALERIVKHSVTIALAVRQPDFRIKPKHFKDEPGEAWQYEEAKQIDMSDFLARLRNNDE